MERKKCLYAGLIWACMALLMIDTAIADNSVCIYSAYVTGNMEEWVKVMEEMEHSELNDISSQKELLNYYYGYTGYLLGEGRKGEAKKYVDKGENLISLLEKENDNDAEVLACKGIFVGYKMQLSKIKTPVLGPICMKYVNKAYELNPENIQVMVDKGYVLYNAPSLFGGNKEEGLDYLQEAALRLENSGDHLNNWTYLNILISIIDYAEKMNNPELSQVTNDKLKIYRP